jgi:hypothetical protein
MRIFLQTNNNSKNNNNNFIFNFFLIKKDSNTKIKWNLERCEESTLFIISSCCVCVYVSHIIS